MADDRLKILEDRLTRLEAVLTQRPPIGAFGGGVVDPPPWTGGGGWVPRPMPIVDPAPWWPGWPRPRWPWPPYFADPAPWPTPVVDPAPWTHVAPIAAQPAPMMAFARPGHVVDPASFDLSNLPV